MLIEDEQSFNGAHAFALSLLFIWTGCEVRDGVGLSAGVSSWMMQARFNPACTWATNPKVALPRHRKSVRREPRLRTWPTYSMAIEVQPPTFKEALKQDRAQFDDCTPCRVVGALPLETLPQVNAVRHELTCLQAAQPSLASAPSPTCPVTRN